VIVAKFVDAAGEEWPLALTVADLEAVRDDAGVDLGDVGEEGAYTALAGLTPVAFARVLWVLCRDRAAAKGLDPAGFKRRLDGRAVEGAVTALMESLVDFFHRPLTAAALKGRLRAEMDRLDGAAAAAVSGSTPSAGATSSPGTSAATPGP
jgi:hypothetical protein